MSTLFVDLRTVHLRKNSSGITLVVDKSSAPVNLKSNNQQTEKVKAVNISNSSVEKIEYKLRLTESDKKLLRKLDMEHRAKLLRQTDVEKQLEEEQLKEKANNVHTIGIASEEREIEVDKKLETKQVETTVQKVVAVPNPKSKLKVKKYI